MNKNDLIQMADLVGYDVDDDDDVYAPASGRYGLDPRLEHFAQLVAGYTLRYECPKQSTDKSINDAVQKAIAIEQEACAKHYLEIMRNAVDKAILREREECAKLCEDLFLSDGEWCAKSIRARDMYTKQENSDTSEECVHESDKSIHQAWDTSDMAHRSGGLSVEHEIDRLKDLNQRLVTVAKELGAADDTHEWDDAWSKMCKIMKEIA